MSRVIRRLRALLVGVLATAVAAVVLRAAAVELVTAVDVVTAAGTGPLLDRSFPLLLGWVAALALAAATTWGWAAVVAVVLRVLASPGRAGQDHQRVGGVPRRVQRVVLAACGVAVVGGLALPAHADPGTVGPGTSSATGAGALTGLPLPTRATAGGAAAATGLRPSTHVVRPGESLWSIAADRLPPGAADADVVTAWQAVHRANRAVVGSDPDLIHPAQRLRLPGLREEPS